MKKVKRYTAHDVAVCLGRRHGKDFYTTGVKTGPSYVAKGMLGIMDALAMKKSWTNPLITAYEIKVNRQDFLRDSKWQRYLDYCNEFYFACPPDLISVDELPPHVGLIYCTTVNRVIRKAQYREVEIPESMFRYILMNKIESDRYPLLLTKGEMWQRWYDNKLTNNELASSVSSKLLTQITDLQKQLQDANRSANKLKEIKDVLTENGINLTRWDWQQNLKKTLAEKGSFQSQNTVKELYDLSSKICDMARKLNG